MHKQKQWSIYIMLLGFKIYLRRSMTTTEAVKWLLEKCESNNTNYFICGKQVFCEYK